MEQHDKIAVTRQQLATIRTALDECAAYFTQAKTGILIATESQIDLIAAELWDAMSIIEQL